MCALETNKEGQRALAAALADKRVPRPPLADAHDGITFAAQPTLTHLPPTHTEPPDVRSPTPAACDAAAICLRLRDCSRFSQPPSSLSSPPSSRPPLLPNSLPNLASATAIASSCSSFSSSFRRASSLLARSLLAFMPWL